MVYADRQYPRYIGHPAHSSTEITLLAFIPPRVPFLAGHPKSIPGSPSNFASSTNASATSLPGSGREKQCHSFNHAMSACWGPDIH